MTYEDDDLLTIDYFLSDLKERSWIQRAACRGLDTNMFYPERGDKNMAKAARSVCEQCPVIDDCMEYGISEKFGLWGGTSVMERRRLRKQRKQ